jgi:hypothetical protein
MTKAEVLQELESLAARLRSKEPSDRDLEAVMHNLKEAEGQIEKAPDATQRSILGLKGLGKEIWADVDADEYVNELRDAWPRR